jgi:hypothetical protein
VDALATALARSRRDLAVAGVVLGWIGVALVLDAHGGIWRQRLLGLVTWLILLWLLRGESPSVRAQVAVAIVVATAVEYTFSPFLGYYTYHLHNVPAYVPPGHGGVYLAALALGRSPLFRLVGGRLVAFTLGVGALWALWGAVLSPRHDLLGLVMFALLVRFLLVGRAPLVFVGAFVVTTYLEFLGTGLGTWRWAAHDPMGWLGIGNPPSGVAGGYGVFDACALAFAPALLVLARRARLPLAQRRHRQAEAGEPGVVVLGRLAVPRPDHGQAAGVDRVRQGEPLVVGDAG